jgi:hypothetical protein
MVTFEPKETQKMSWWTSANRPHPDSFCYVLFIWYTTQICGWVQTGWAQQLNGFDPNLRIFQAKKTMMTMMTCGEQNLSGWWIGTSFIFPYIIYQCLIVRTISEEMVTDPNLRPNKMIKNDAVPNSDRYISDDPSCSRNVHPFRYLQICKAPVQVLPKASSNSIPSTKMVSFFGQNCW